MAPAWQLQPWQYLSIHSMRALLLLLVVVLAFLAVRWFNADPVGAADAGQTVLDEGAQFLDPPAHLRTDGRAEKTDPSVPEAAKGEKVASLERSGASQSTPSGTAWPTRDASRSPEAEVAAAALLVHGTPAEVQAAATSLPPERALLLEAFSWAVAGEAQMARSLAAKLEAVAGSREQALLEAALTGRALGPTAPASGAVPLAMEMALLAREGRQALVERRFPEAAAAFSDLLKAEIGAPWEPDRGCLGEWTEGLDQAQREHRWSPRSDWPSVEVVVQPGDNLIAIRLRFVGEHPGAVLCTGMIERANRLKGYLQPKQVLRIPTEPVRILVDLDARWALYFLGEEVAAAWPVGIGRPGEETPPGDYTVRNKLEDPPWMKEGQEPIPFGDPRNPLGTRWIGWSREGARTSYGFHGTWEPESIGEASSDGCIRFQNGDVEALFQILPEGAPIRIQGG